MPLNDRPKWILATAAAIAATGVGGVALASGGGSESALPDSVSLQDRVPAVTQTIEASATPTLFEVRSGPIVRAEDGSFTTQSVTSDSFDSPDSADTTDSAVSFDSVDSVASVETTESVDSVDSVDTVTPFDSVDSADSF